MAFVGFPPDFQPITTQNVADAMEIWTPVWGANLHLFAPALLFHQEGEPLFFEQVDSSTRGEAGEPERRNSPDVSRRDRLLG